MGAQGLALGGVGGVLVRGAIWEPLTGFKEETDRSNLCFRAIMLAAGQRKAWSSGLKPQMRCTRESEMDANLGFTPPDTHVLLVRRERKGKRGSSRSPCSGPASGWERLGQERQHPESLRGSLGDEVDRVWQPVPMG